LNSCGGVQGPDITLSLPGKSSSDPTVLTSFPSPGPCIVMSILEILPPEIFRMILQFLELPKELIHLDNAILNHRLRSFYLKTIEGMKGEISENVIVDYYDHRKSVWL
jgi:hypothetical protein